VRRGVVLFSSESKCAVWGPIEAWVPWAPVSPDPLDKTALEPTNLTTKVEVSIVVAVMRVEIIPSAKIDRRYISCAVMPIQFQLKRIYHSGNVSSSSVNGDIAIQWEWSNFDHS